jgi:hypothetical protein
MYIVNMDFSKYMSRLTFGSGGSNSWRLVACCVVEFKIQLELDLLAEEIDRNRGPTSTRSESSPLISWCSKRALALLDMVIKHVPKVRPVKRRPILGAGRPIGNLKSAPLQAPFDCRPKCIFTFIPLVFLKLICSPKLRCLKQNGISLWPQPYRYLLHICHYGDSPLTIGVMKF